MLISHEREKLIQAIIFFANNTRAFGKVKLYKLLYFLDFEHFKLTGRSVTGQDYDAWRMGPVPAALHKELKAPEADLTNAVEFSEKELGNGKQPMLTMRAKIPFNPDLFSRRELGILKDLAKLYRDAKSEDMIEATHLENLPWAQVYHRPDGKFKTIPYEYAIRADEFDSMISTVRDREEILDFLK